MDMNAMISLAHQVLPVNLWDKAVTVAGYATIFGQIVPMLLTWGIPAAIRAADWVARVGLASPLRPLILWKAAAIIAFLDKFTAALEQIADTFKSRLEADIKAAVAADQAAKPAADAPKAV